MRNILAISMTGEVITSFIVFFLCFIAILALFYFYLWYTLVYLDREKCIGCSKRFDYKKIEQDDAGENYCPKCWVRFEPIFQAEYNELKAKGEID